MRAQISIIVLLAFVLVSGFCDAAMAVGGISAGGGDPNSDYVGSQLRITAVLTSVKVLSTAKKISPHGRFSGVEWDDTLNAYVVSVRGFSCQIFARTRLRTVQNPETPGLSKDIYEVTDVGDCENPLPEQRGNHGTPPSSCVPAELCSSQQ